MQKNLQLLLQGLYDAVKWFHEGFILEFNIINGRVIMTKKNILKSFIFALSFLSFFAAISVHAKEDCSEALIRALTEEGLSEQQIDTICKKIKQYSKPEIKLSAIEETTRTVVEALINGDEEVLRKLYSHNNRFFIRNINNYYPDFNSTQLDDYDFDIKDNTAIITRYSDRNIKFKLHMVNKENDVYLWEEIRRFPSEKPKKKNLFDSFFD